MTFKHLIQNLKCGGTCLSIEVQQIEPEQANSDLDVLDFDVLTLTFTQLLER